MKILYAFLFFKLFVIYNSFGQLNADSLFNSAIEDAKHKDYYQAIDKASHIVALDTNRLDVILFLANVNAWTNNTQNALIYIHRAYAIAPTNNEVIETFCNILHWGRNYKELIQFLDGIQSKGYNNSYFLTKKYVIAYKELEEFDKAITYIKSQNPQILDSTDINEMYIEILSLQKKQHFSLYYNLDYFENNSPTPHQLAYIEYGRKIKKHSAFARLNYTNRFQLYDLQPEIDLYIKQDKTHYLYTNYAYGIYNTLFPQHRAGIEYYFPVLRSYDASIGARYINYPKVQVFMATGHFCKYFKHSYITGKPFLGIANNDTFFAGRLTYKIHKNNPLDFWSFELGYGNSPDDADVLQISNNYIRLNAYVCKIEKNILLKKFQEIKIACSYSYEEYVNSQYRNKIQLELLYTFKL